MSLDLERVADGGANCSETRGDGGGDDAVSASSKFGADPGFSLRSTAGDDGGGDDAVSDVSSKFGADPGFSLRDVYAGDDGDGDDAVSGPGFSLRDTAGDDGGGDDAVSEVSSKLGADPGFRGRFRLRDTAGDDGGEVVKESAVAVIGMSPASCSGGGTAGFSRRWTGGEEGGVHPTCEIVLFLQ